MTLTQGHTIKVTLHTYPNSLSGPLLLTAMLDLDNTIVVQVTLTRGHIFKVMVTVYIFLKSVSGP